MHTRSTSAQPRRSLKLLLGGALILLCLDACTLQGKSQGNSAVTVSSHATPTPRCAAVTTIISGGNGPFTFISQAGKAWASDQVVVGTIEEKSAHWEIVGDEPLIRTYSRLRVEERVRGRPEPTLLIRTVGGTLDGCTQHIGDEASLRVGERLLLFLRQSDTSTSDEIRYFVVSGSSSVWTISSDGQAATNSAGLVQMPLIDLLGEIQQALEQPPPPDLDPQYVVAPDRAPLAPMATRSQ
jgi:hypothetical protein